MSSVSELVTLFKRTTAVIQAQAKGLSHEDMIILPPFRGNCFNWVLGHVVHSRQVMLEALAGEVQMTDEERAPYKRDAIMEDLSAAVDSGRLLALLDGAHDAMLELLAQHPARLDEIWDEERGTTVGDWISFLHWHETYHTGELAVLRQLAGTDDKII